MTRNTSYTRRRVLQLTGAAAVAGLAGCTGTEAEQPAGTATTAPTTEVHEEGHGEDGHDDTTEDGDHDHEEDGHDDTTEDGGHSHEEGVGEPTETAAVSMLTEDGGYHFEPHVVGVETGGTVTFVNESGRHSAAAYHPGNDQPQLVPDGTEAWDSGLFTEDGATFEHTFETEGVYHYYCAPHEKLGMLGSVIVGEPEAHGQPALEEPPADKPEAVREKIAELNEMCKAALGHGH
jgi:plastocyanin